MTQEGIQDLRVRQFQRDQVPTLELNDIDLSLFRDLEIGGGVGHFAIQYAKENPGRRLLSVEKTTEKYLKFHRRVQNHNLDNLLSLHANAVSVVTHLIKESSLEKVFILYPNPELKRKNNRWHRSSFMWELRDKMKSGAQIQISTNLKEYADESVEYMESVFGFILLEQKEFFHSDKPKTHFEKKYLLRKQPCYDLIFCK